MATAEDLIEGTIAYLKADTDVSNLVGSRVYGMELPRADTDSQPEKTIVLSPSGGAMPSFASATVPVQVERVDVRCFGENPYEAQRVRRVAYATLKALQRAVHGTVLLHWAQPAGGANNLRDPDSDWPVVVQPFQIAADERSA